MREWAAKAAILSASLQLRVSEDCVVYQGSILDPLIKRLIAIVQDSPSWSRRISLASPDLVEPPRKARVPCKPVFKCRQLVLEEWE